MRRLFLLNLGELAMALELLRDADDGQEHYCFARIVRARHYAAAAWGIVPTCQRTV